MSQEPRDQPIPAAPGAAQEPAAPPVAYPPQIPPAERVRAACHRRSETDYIFDYWSALGWTFLTLGIYGLYVLYQLVRRMRDHNVRRLELFDASIAVAWEQARRQGLQEELRPSFERAAAHLAALRQMTADFRDPGIWLVLALVARGIVDIVAFVLLDQDLVKHDRAELGVEYEVSVIYAALGQQVPARDPSRVKGPDNYVGRVLATVFSLGIYMFWWFYDQMEQPNRHFRSNWPEEDALAGAVSALE